MTEKTKGARAEYKCDHCKTLFMARVADRKRGWARFCSKSCKAKKQEKRTGQMTNYLMRGHRGENYNRDYFMDDHPFSSDALGQW